MIGDDDLRDCFAMFAMMAIIPSMGGKSIGVGETENNERFAMLCYALSDAMMEARKKVDPAEGIVAIKKRVRKT